MKKAIIIIIMSVGLAVSFAGQNVVAQEVEQKYEYICVKCPMLSTPPKKQTKFINKYAKNGWRLMTVFNLTGFAYYYFEREL